jgi:putative salt-induced outer membrane protein YdiY
MTIRATTILVLLALAAAPAAADVVELANGDRLSGTVRSIDGSAAVIATGYAGVVVVDREAVAAVETDGVLNVATEAGDFDDVRLVRAASGEQAVDAPDGIREIGFGNLRAASVRTPTVQADDRWEAQVTYGLNISTGNSDTQAHSLRANTRLRREDLRHTLGADVDRKTDDGTVTKDQQRIGYQLDWFFRDDWYAYGTGEYFKDDLKEVDYRVTLGAGAGHQFWDDSLGALSAEAGVSEVIEEIGGEQETNPAARFGVDYNRFLVGRRLELFHENELLVLADLDRGQILDTSTGLRVRMSERWTADFRVDLTHETEPADDQEETDVTYIIGVGMSW